MTLRALSFSALSSSFILSLSSCGGTPAEAIRPKDQTYASAMGESSTPASCHEVDAYGEPLVVDWKPEQRGDLEVLMRDGVAVVNYSCKGLKVLKECKIDGKYGFLGMTRKEQLVRLNNQDEVKANLPLGGIGIAANIGAEMERGASLDVAIMMIGKKKTTWGKVSADELKGECDGATHFVRGATIGAFVMETGSKAQARTAAQVFGAGASGGSSSAKNVRNQDGDPADCSKSSPDAPTPPAQCQAIVRLELKSIAPKTQGGAAPAESAAKAPPEPQAQAIQVADEPCPKGLVFADGKCTAGKDAKAFLCEPTNGAQCVDQCSKGHAGSCGIAGSLHASGGGGLSRDDAKARELLGKGCDGGDIKACLNLGSLFASGRGGAKDASAAAKNFERACKEGEASGCGRLALAHRSGDGVGKDDAKAASLFRQGCDGGDDMACGSLGRMMLDGAGVSKDAAKGAELLKRACDGSQANACVDLGRLYEVGKDIGKNAIIAKMLYQRGCIRGDFGSCADQARLELGQGGNADAAKRGFEQACTFKRIAVACAAVNVLYGGKQQVMANPAESNELMTKCNGGSVRDCASAGVLNLASGNKPLATTQIERACIGGDPLACAVKGKK